MISVEITNESTIVKTTNQEQSETITTKLHKIGILKKASLAVLIAIVVGLMNKNLPTTEKFVKLAEQAIPRRLCEKIKSHIPQEATKPVLTQMLAEVGRTLMLLYALYLIVHKYGMQFLWGQLLKANLIYTDSKIAGSLLDSSSKNEKPRAYIVSANRSGIIVRNHYFAVEHTSPTKWIIYQKRKKQGHGMQIVPIITHKDVVVFEPEVSQHANMVSSIKCQILYNHKVATELMKKYNKNSQQRIIITNQELKSMIVLAQILAYHAHYQRSWYMTMCLRAVHLSPYVILVAFQSLGFVQCWTAVKAAFEDLQKPNDTDKPQTTTSTTNDKTNDEEKKGDNEEEEGDDEEKKKNQPEHNATNYLIVESSTSDRPSRACRYFFAVSPKNKSETPIYIFVTNGPLQDLNDNINTHLKKNVTLYHNKKPLNLRQGVRKFITDTYHTKSPSPIELTYE